MRARNRPIHRLQSSILRIWGTAIVAAVDLSKYDQRGYHPGAGLVKRTLWYVVNALFFHSWLCPVSGPKRWLLRVFGAQIGLGVVIKPRVNIKYPWFLAIGENSWIGEGVWIDNLTWVRIGSNVCISQDAYLLTGNHDYKDAAFGLMFAPVTVADGAWVGAKAIVCPGITIASHSVVTVGSVVQQDTDTYGIYRGNPGQKCHARKIAE